MAKLGLKAGGSGFSGKKPTILTKPPEKRSKDTPPVTQGNSGPSFGGFKNKK